ncbi:PLC-like phosphodiesterase [Neohortaea acidophila]|uniref:PLC-like phosphodiesterase n=1 Tax=Neohortaea acidophila TaxID=245834 RepID=A0A6A6Q4X9_9PEZI|nr:PLC-like phosphodiesterase [Neohortaea acidophila]KAF2487498.1 PLC-like phosphodiesterase [Neohortaea acidophila]
MPRPPPQVAEYALDKVLNDASPVFGAYENVQSDSSTWMSHYPDETNIVHMNIPGAHDAATWNYSEATRQSMEHITSLVSDTSIDPSWFRCQNRSMIDMLNAGVRAFDLRAAQDVTKSTLVFWHGPALQSQTATLDLVLHAFYKWLEDHPSETVLLSIKHEGSKDMKNFDDAAFQQQLYETLTSPAAKRYILQDRNVFGTLGQARGKAILLRRFDLNLLSTSHQNAVPGIHFSPQKWTVNSANLALIYNANPNPKSGDAGVAYIEDFYHPTSPTLVEDIELKYAAVQSHLRRAASSRQPDALYWTFTSGTNTKHDSESSTPRKVALGREKADGGSPTNGVNQRLVNLLSEFHGQRLGIVMFDYFAEPDDLLPKFLGLRAP